MRAAGFNPVSLPCHPGQVPAVMPKLLGGTISETRVMMGILRRGLGISMIRMEHCQLDSPHKTAIVFASDVEAIHRMGRKSTPPTEICWPRAGALRPSRQYGITGCAALKSVERRSSYWPNRRRVSCSVQDIAAPRSVLLTVRACGDFCFETWVEAVKDCVVHCPPIRDQRTTFKR